jgi:hypothetical protein
VDILPIIIEGDPASFWAWFAQAAPRIGRDYAAALDDRLEVETVMDEVSHHLHQYHSELTIEIGKVGELFDLVISADGIKSNIEPALRLTQAFPSIPGWKVTAFRQRMKITDILLQAGEMEVDWGRVFFLLEPPEDDRCDLTIGFEKGSLPADADLSFPGFLTADISLGEYDVMTKIRSMEFVWLEQAGPSFLPIVDLTEKFDEYFPYVAN